MTVCLYVLQDSVAEKSLKLGPLPRYALELLWQQLAVTSSVSQWRGQWFWFSVIFDADPATVWLATIGAGTSLPSTAPHHNYIDFLAHNYGVHQSSVYRMQCPPQESGCVRSRPAKTHYISAYAAHLLAALNMTGLATQLGAVPDPATDSKTEVVRFPIDYIGPIYTAHLLYGAVDDSQENPVGVEANADHPMRLPVAG